MLARRPSTIWIGFIIFMIALLAAGYGIHNTHLQNEIDNFEEELTAEAELVSFIIHDQLQKHDYKSAEDFILNFGEKTNDIVEILLVSPNGFKLAHYLSKQTSEHVISRTINIRYSYDSSATLELSKKIDHIYRHDQLFITQLFIGYITIGVVLYYLAYSIALFGKQKHALVNENRQRIETERQLEETLNSLKERERNLNVTLNSIGDAVITTDQNGHIARMNPAAEYLTGWKVKQAMSEPLDRIFNIINEITLEPEDSPAREVLASGKLIKRDNDVILISKTGKKYNVAVSAAPIVETSEEILGVALVFHDITEQKRYQDKIRSLSQAVEQSPVSVMITDMEGRIEYVNSTFEKVSGYSSYEVIGKNPKILKSGQTSMKVYEDLWRTIKSGKAWKGEILNRKKNGELYWESANIAPVLNPSGQILHYLAVREDITHRRQQEEQILHQAHFDSLTDLPNRFLSLDRLSQLVRDGQRNNELVAVLFLDLDDFKKINDTLGHDIGDKLLIEAASRLQKEVRDGDTVGRLGGDEFIVLLGGLSHASDARPVVENLLNRFRDSFIIDNREMILTISVGISIYPNDGNDPSELLRNADSAMYHSKEQGRNTYSYFTDSMNHDVARRLSIEEQMHGALSRGEFYINYQPKVSVANRDIVGVEALIRWNNPALGDISPNEFIPIAEQTGLIIPIGQYILTEAITMAASWQTLYNDKFSISINLSPRQFRDPKLVSFIGETLNKSGIKGELLELEITEGVLMSAHSYIHDSLSAINKLGVTIAMDDFGTGFSSLSYLRQYPFDALKIDQSFVGDITNDKADRELVNAAIVMAHSLGLTVVAEGVETEEQLTLLAKMGCDVAQGFLFSQAVDAETIVALLTDKNKLASR